jgi:membrane protease YdiL (CAAX protease family)
MPRWPGPLLLALGLVVGLGGPFLVALLADGPASGNDSAALGWLLIAGAALFTAGLLYLAIRQLRVRRFLAPERYRGPSVVVLLLLALVLASVITAPFGADVTALLVGDGELTFLGATALLMATQVALLLVSWFLVFRPGALEALPSIPGRDPGRAIRLGLGWGVIAWLGATLVSAAVVWLLETLGVPAEPQAAERAIEVLDPWLVILAIVILAPIAEEVFFRGVVFNAWLREGGRRWAFIGSAALFALIHISVVALLPIFLLGIALAWVYDRTGNLLAPIAMHATVNLVRLPV